MREPSSVPSRKRISFRTIACLLGLAVAVLASEFALRWRRQSISRGEQMDPGMIRRDALLGWRLTPAWRGSHRHRDFRVEYSVDEKGYRREPLAAKDRSGGVYAVVGDSFTFGLGANDDQTFVHLLNQGQGGPDTFLNLAVPGYSTDQVALLIDEELAKRKLKGVLLVVYLGNDLFDNLRTYPLQFNAPKPRFESVGGELVLHQVLPGVGAKPAGALPADVMAEVLGNAYPRSSWRLRLERRSELFRLVSDQLLPARDWSPQLQAALRPALDLFYLITRRARRQCDQHDAPLTLVLLAGRSHATQPESFSAQCQEYLRAKTVAWAGAEAIRLIDIALAARQQSRAARAALFHPNDGHLTAAGHQFVAGAIRQALSP